jgi:hypothetical protein
MGLQAYEEELARWNAGLDVVIAEARRVEDPIERLLLAARHWIAGTRFDNHPVTGRPPHARLFNEALPEFWPVLEEVDPTWLGTGKQPPWNSEAVARWFARKAKSLGVQPKIFPSPGLFSRVRGWHVGSTNVHQGMMRREDKIVRISAFVSVKGDLSRGPISDLGLHDMTLILGLERAGWVLQPPPAPPPVHQEPGVDLRRQFGLAP